MNEQEQAALEIPSPCRQICRLGDGDICLGCLRTLDEIARWAQMTEREKIQVWERLGDPIE